MRCKLSTNKSLTRRSSTVAHHLSVSFRGVVRIFSSRLHRKLHQKKAKNRNHDFEVPPEVVNARGPEITFAMAHYNFKKITVVPTAKVCYSLYLVRYSWGSVVFDVFVVVQLSVWTAGCSHIWGDLRSRSVRMCICPQNI